ANNQVGFTTDPSEGRSTRYSSDLAKGFDVPIVHVNADDPEAAISAIRLALAYRRRFESDVVVDLDGYRRHGHNEQDEAAYTQPLMAAQIADHPTVRQEFARRLIEEGVVTQAEAEAMVEQGTTELRAAHEALGFASLIVGGIPIRLTGQATARVTFSHRHAVLHDVATGETYVPLEHLDDATASFEIYNSPLSEFACLGFEYGYSVAAPEAI